jgi:short-subunit dehydrogenase involved in D-alanine esterification of teichoic acids
MEYRKKVGTTNTGIKSDKCAASIVDGLEKDKFEIENPALENLKTATMKDIDKLFEKMNGRW